ncbi:RHS repeat-associated core domain-containing protein, partial [Chitinispirillales bacterium ANBcel5]|uniref:RHS repeat-associated core domain-containing protein n=1 Tax=Cellulosispirillum alkaliphilum TaxID=3039283 RepID=UPI002A568635|nr:RHS repeat-associated core domain-containing protein [Chitinispirillales bacterium ANBcel5]
HVMDDTSRIAIVNHWTKDDHLREIDSSDDLGQNKIRYQYGNHLGSASLELNEAGELISYEEYFPYGGTSFVVGNSEKEVKLKEYRYTGKERDDATGLYYYGARYYAAWIGRWLSADPAGPVDGWNLYEYVRGNPVGLVDPDGMTSERHDVGIKFPEGVETAEDLKEHLSNKGTFEYDGIDYYLEFDGELDIEMVDGVPKITGDNLMAREFVAGAIVPPATNSNHHAGHAIDMNILYNKKLYRAVDLNPNNIKRLPQSVQNFINDIRNDSKLRWGGDFSPTDPVHIDDGLNISNPEVFRQRVIAVNYAYQAR